MKNRLHIFIILLFLILPHFNFAQTQNKKPKVALVLSGGGAKGLAHIPLLQTLDSLGIVPDLIVGTSMGSIVGGLYAMGYSGDSIATIANNAQWDKLLSGDVSLDLVGVEEKSEFGKYLIDFDLENGKPKPNSALLNDQNLREFLSYLNYPVFKINDFDQLPIPYRAIATDLINGTEVILDSGYMSFAMRASMSIPSIFEPVPYKNTLLVDGGILNNFPVDIALDMGADIVIGSDIGGKMIKKEQLNNIVDILFQTSMLTSKIKSRENRKNCDILIDHAPNLTYGTEDFGKSKEIYEEGKIATMQNEAVLSALAEKLKAYPQRKHELPYVKDELILDTIIYNNISKDNLELVKARININTHQKLSTQDIILGVNTAMGANIFKQITFSPTFDNEKLGIQLNGFEKAKHQLQGSVHYDDDRGIGIIANYTGRNILGSSSRFLISADIAQQPRIRLQNQKNFGKKKTWWWKSEVFGQKIQQKYYVNGEESDNYNSKFLQIDNQINKNINALKSYVGFGINYENNYLSPKTSSTVRSNIYNINSYRMKNIELKGLYVFNTLNKTFFPTKGTYIDASIGRSLYHNINIDFYMAPNNSGSTNGFTKIGANFEKRITHGKFTSIIEAHAAYIILDELQSDEYPFIDNGIASKNFLGGNILRPSKNKYLFQGLHEGELCVTQFSMLKLGMQYSHKNKLYITPYINIASVGFDGFSNYISNAYKPKGNWQDMDKTSSLISAGTTFSYNSFLGPINLDLAWVNDINKVRLSFNLGIEFNRSN